MTRSLGPGSYLGYPEGLGGRRSRVLQPSSTHLWWTSYGGGRVRHAMMRCVHLKPDSFHQVPSTCAGQWVPDLGNICSFPDTPWDCHMCRSVGVVPGGQCRHIFHTWSVWVFSLGGRQPATCGQQQKPQGRSNGIFTSSTRINPAFLIGD